MQSTDTQFNVWIFHIGKSNKVQNRHFQKTVLESVPSQKINLSYYISNDDSNIDKFYCWGVTRGPKNDKTFMSRDTGDLLIFLDHLNDQVIYAWFKKDLVVSDNIEDFSKTVWNHEKSSLYGLPFIFVNRTIVKVNNLDDFKKQIGYKALMGNCILSDKQKTSLLNTLPEILDDPNRIAYQPTENLIEIPSQIFQEPEGSGIIYLVHEQRHWIKGEEIFKIGKTANFDDFRRIKSYKHARVLLALRFLEIDETENKLLAIFREAFGDPVIGNETFHGNPDDMLNIICHHRFPQK